ncbi:MAG: hypothetical protein J0L69_12355 [Bacteroidetes bacterium]|nr:hypothetical protein [Bacteroidota bacterium]
MLKTSKYLIVLSSFILSLSCVKTKVVQNEYHYPRPDELFDYCYFKPGTYWVMEDSLSNKVDSIYITKAVDDIYNVSKDLGWYFYGTFYRFNCEMFSSYDKYSYSNSIDQSQQNINGMSKTSVKRQRVSTISSSNPNGEAFVFSEEKSKSLYLNQSVSSFAGSTYSITINSNTFYNVQKWSINTSGIDANSNANYYLSKKIGIIKRVINDSNQNWKLIRYNIVQ